MEPAISVKGVGKQYRIGAKERADRTLRETIVDLAVTPFRRLGQIGKAPAPEELIWALKDVSFNVQPGEVVGIIGRNGAGKSTLLKIMSRITEPTEGRIELHGRIASLLEVGTGFHPELTGRENIYLNGTILGMKKAEIDRKFNEIVAFSEIEKFLDTPVKRYSSGMYVRLAFAVAAHLDPEILLVDEVLAVGDAGFQKKCLGKMNEVAKAGRTVLFVSHNMAAVQQFCQRIILLEGGRVRLDSETIPAIEQYLALLNESREGVSVSEMPRDSSAFGQVVRISEVKGLDASRRPATVFPCGSSVAFQIAMTCSNDIDDVDIIFGIDNFLGVQVTTVSSEEISRLFHGSKDRPIRAEIAFKDLRLNTGRYWLRVGARRHKIALDLLRQALCFEVADVTNDAHPIDRSLWGLVRCDPVWTDTQICNTARKSDG
jgi:lipopolysaccharide transport system ATP-binding protein